MKKYHDIAHVSIDHDHLRITIDGIDHSFLLDSISQKLANALSAVQNKYEISPSGYGIHWPELDEDLSIDGLLNIRHSPSANRDVSPSLSSPP